MLIYNRGRRAPDMRKEESTLIVRLDHGNGIRSGSLALVLVLVVEVAEDPLVAVLRRRVRRAAGGASLLALVAKGDLHELLRGPMILEGGKTRELLGGLRRR